MNQEAVLNIGFLNCAKATGIFMAICGSIDFIMGIRLEVFVRSRFNSSQVVIVDGFWSGIPLLITGLWLVLSTRKRTKQAILTCAIPCLITFITSLLQAISSGKEATTLARISMRNCSHHSACGYIQSTYACLLGLVIASSIGAGTCFFSLMLAAAQLESATENTTPTVINGVELAQPSTQVVISSDQTTTTPIAPDNCDQPMQHPINYGPPEYSVQPNNR